MQIRKYGVVGVTGMNGAGKTLFAVDQALQIADGRPILSTVAFNGAEQLRSLTRLLEAERTLVVLDEVSTLFSSRNTTSLPSEMQIFLQTLRHRQCQVIWTAPAFGRADLMLRESTLVEVKVTAWLKKRSDHDLWGEPRFCTARYIDRSNYTAGELSDTKQTERKITTTFYRPRKLASWGVFDTHAPTPKIGGLLPKGNCPDCGGSRKSIACTTEVHAQLGLQPPIDRLALATLTHEQTRSESGGTGGAPPPVNAHDHEPNHDVAASD